MNINISDGWEVDPLFVSGIDVPLSKRVTLTSRVNVSFGEEDTDVGLLLGVGYSLFR
ncbi:hypothetical protein [Iningainema tapete]|uniref:Uncharacterized protein n=1 Tax=Iningainema tapete BLCC-T55 TaxID=2748662 RepID=A0A8J6XFI8_9CYAN|nr:hypothetical protein [Iningainema tapete]MBD2775700.1 hypothetical protein [Iningainema tapete BLCC-T55]